MQRTEQRKQGVEWAGDKEPPFEGVGKGCQGDHDSGFLSACTFLFMDGSLYSMSCCCHGQSISPFLCSLQGGGGCLYPSAHSLHEEPHSPSPVHTPWRFTLPLALSLKGRVDRELSIEAIGQGRRRHFDLSLSTSLSLPPFLSPHLFSPSLLLSLK